MAQDPWAGRRDSVGYATQPGRLARSPRHATRQVARCGEAVASLAGLVCVTERSPGSESVYLHLLRDGVWRGLRISCHAPAYDCCHDYEQLLLRPACSRHSISMALRRVAARVRSGGRVVADPQAVSAAIGRLALQLSDGRLYRDRRGNRWRWDGSGESWSPLGAARTVAGPPPEHTGLRPLSPRVRCEIRHAMNVTACWEAELAGHAVAGPPR